jgi:hypothetical protein
MSPLVAFSFNILDPDAAALSEALPRLFNATEKAHIVFESIVEPVVLGSEAYQHTDRLPVPSDDDLFALGVAQKSGDIIWISDSGTCFTRIPISLSQTSAASLVRSPRFRQSLRFTKLAN